MNRTIIRAIVTALTGLLSMTGLLPEEAQSYINANADAVIGAVLVLWGVVAGYKGYKASRT